VLLLTNKDASLIMKGDCTAGVCKVVCCMEESWPVRKEEIENGLMDVWH